MGRGGEEAGVGRCRRWAATPSLRPTGSSQLDHISELIPHEVRPLYPCQSVAEGPPPREGCDLEGGNLVGRDMEGCLPAPLSAAWGVSPSFPKGTALHSIQHTPSHETFTKKIRELQQGVSSRRGGLCFAHCCITCTWIKAQTSEYSMKSKDCVKW